MDHNDQEEEKPVQGGITLFGEPVIKTQCQKNALITGIIGGIFGGLVGFIFTSSPKKSTRIGAGTYFVISVTYACYCAYDEIQTMKHIRQLKQAIEAAKAKNISKDMLSDDATT